MLFGQRLFGNALQAALFLRSQSRVPQVSVPSYSPEGSRQFVIGGLLSYYTIQRDELEYISYGTYETSIPPPIRQSIMMSMPEPVYMNDTEFNQFIVSGTYKVTGVPVPSSAGAPDQPGEIDLWGDENEDLLLWGDESGQTILWGDTPT